MQACVVRGARLHIYDRTLIANLPTRPWKPSRVKGGIVRDCVQDRLLCGGSVSGKSDSY